MSGTSLYHGILFVLYILIFLVAIASLSYMVPHIRRRNRVLRMQEAQGADWQRAYRKNQAAVDAVIVELESAPATYETFPQSVRESLYAAHEAAAAIEGKR